VKRRDLVKVLGVGAWGMGVRDWSGALAPWLPGSLATIGIQLYTVRRDLQRDVEGTLARVAEIGFREVEFAGFPQGSGASLRAMLDRHRLTAPSGHVPFQAIRAEWDRTLDDGAAVGQSYVVVAFISPAERKTPEDWKRVAALFNKAGEASRARKIQFAYHNHDFEFTPIEGTIGYDILLAETDPTLVQFEMDLYWITKGGRDPLDYFAKHPGRFPLLHVKDMAPEPARGFADLGKGVIDFKRIFRRAGQAGAKHFFYEQDVTPGPAFDSAKVGYQYLKQLRF
jgi:sugar phosphate isomerase/epimerase